MSRQVIVQDIALLRATNKNILSTNKGYFLYNPGKGPQKPKRSFCVQHTTEQMQDELYTIVDYGGKVLDAVVEHDIRQVAISAPISGIVTKLREKGYLQE